MFLFPPRDVPRAAQFTPRATGSREVVQKVCQLLSPAVEAAETEPNDRDKKRDHKAGGLDTPESEKRERKARKHSPTPSVFALCANGGI